MELIALDVHKKYSLLRVEGGDRKLIREQRIEHRRGAIRNSLSMYTRGSPVAVETTGNWYWVVRDVEEAGLTPQLVHAGKAKLFMGLSNKTDKLDVKGLIVLQRNGTLPTVWIPPEDLRDKRELPRTRMALTGQRTQLKNRIHATLAKYGIMIEEVSDIFGVRGRNIIEKALGELPVETTFATRALLSELDAVTERIAEIEKRMQKVFSSSKEFELLMTLPGVGKILSVVIASEIGDIVRFPSADRLASYSGTVPTVKSSGGKTTYGRLRSDVNHYLKWAFIEAANSICAFRRRKPGMNVCRLYERIRARKGHQKAIGAVARHLAESAYWVLKKLEPYKDPAKQPESNGESATDRISSTEK